MFVNLTNNISGRENLLVCPGKDVIFECSTNGSSLQWVFSSPTVQEITYYQGEGTPNIIHQGSSPIIAWLVNSDVLTSKLVVPYEAAHDLNDTEVRCRCLEEECSTAGTTYSVAGSFSMCILFVIKKYPPLVPFYCMQGILQKCQIPISK